MTADRDLLFVYGTLRWRRAHPMAAWLWHHAKPVGPAVLQARLYDCNSYPGAVLSQDMSDQVSGLVLRLKNPQQGLKALDLYEGFDPSHRPDSLFDRVATEVVLRSGKALTAWVYVYAPSVENLRRINSWS